MEEIRVSKKDEVNLGVGCSISQARELREYLSCYTKNYHFHPKYIGGFWDGKVSFYNISNNTVPIGLLYKLHTFCNDFNYKLVLDFDYKKMFFDITEDQLKQFYDVIFKGTKFYPRDYQQTAIFKLLKNKRGVTELPTGSGKSNVIYSIIRFMLMMDKQVLLVVPTITLVNQMYSDFQEYGWSETSINCNKLFSGQDLDLNKPVLVSTWQSLFERDVSFFDRFGCLILDEAHKINNSAKGLNSIAGKCRNADFRMGLTGTLPKERVDIYNVYGYLGRKLSEEKSKKLIEKGILSKIKIVNLILKYPKHIIDKVKNCEYQYEYDTILKTEERNKSLDFILNNINKKDNVLILVNRREKHLDPTKEYIKKNFPNKKLRIIHGNIKADEREQIRKNVENEDGVIILATYQTLSTGVNIKKIHHVILYSSYRSYFTVMQSVGRGLRTHKTKKYLILWDIVDWMRWKKKKRKNQKDPLGQNHLYKQWLERLRYYDENEFEYINKKLIL